MHYLVDLLVKPITLDINGQRRQQSTLDQLIWDVPDILHALSKLYALRAGDLSRIDLTHLADEIEDMGRSEQRAFASRLAVIVAHLLKLQILLFDLVVGDGQIFGSLQH